MRGLRLDPNSIVRGTTGQYRLLADGTILDREQPGKVVGFIRSTGELDRIFRMRSQPAKQRALRRIVQGV